MIVSFVKGASIMSTRMVAGKAGNSIGRKR